MILSSKPVSWSRGVGMPQLLPLQSSVTVWQQGPELWEMGNNCREKDAEGGSLCNLNRYRAIFHDHHVLWLFLNKSAQTWLKDDRTE